MSPLSHVTGSFVGHSPRHVVSPHTHTHTEVRFDTTTHVSGEDLVEDEYT